MNTYHQKKVWKKWKNLASIASIAGEAWSGEPAKRAQAARPFERFLLDVLSRKKYPKGVLFL